jgi:hypothetical protein
MKKLGDAPAILSFPRTLDLLLPIEDVPYGFLWRHQPETPHGLPGWDHPGPVPAPEGQEVPAPEVRFMVTGCSKDV